MIGIKLFPYRSSLVYNQMRTTLDGGYWSLKRFDPRVTNDRRSGYMTSNSLEIVGTSTVKITLIGKHLIVYEIGMYPRNLFELKY